MRAILFDFNGVLVDDEPVHLELMQKVLGDEGIELSAEEYYGRCLGLDDRSCLQAVLLAHQQPAPPDRVSRLVARKSAYYHLRIKRDGYPVFPGARELVEASADAGWMLGVVTGALRDEVEGALRQMGVRAVIKTVVSAEDVSRGKPDPEGFRRGLQELNALPPLPERLIHPHEVLAIEDSPAGLTAAAALGLATLGVAHTFAAERLGLADRVVESIDQLSPARLRELFP
jgi:HAD superfamily hydrolase (TIGR01509 family)